MSSPPQTPLHRPRSHRRHPSSLDMSTYSLRRRSSGYGNSPVTPHSTHEFEHSSPGHTFDGQGDNGLGNLADELADAWDDEEEIGEEEGEDGDYPEYGNGVEVSIDHNDSAGPPAPSPIANGVRDSGVALQSSPSVESKSNLSPSKATAAARRHLRQRSLYDGSDYGDDSDFEAQDGISAGLEARMAAVEGLARRGLEENGSPTDQVVKRLTERLRDLGSQAGVESGASRLKTTHDALTAHLTHQTRTITSLSSSLLSPLALPPDPETIEILLELITGTLDLLPHASTDPLYSLSQLTISTRELLQNLSYVSDSLHMSRQSTGVAARRLKSAKEQLAEWKRETELKEQGIRWVEKGEWDRRLRDREAKSVCGDVLDGFEEACGMWRKKLCEELGVVG